MGARPGRGAWLLLAAALLPCLALADVGPEAADGRLTEREFHLLPGGAEPLDLAHGFVDAASVRVIVDGRPWLPDQDFKVRARAGTVVPLRPWRDDVAPDGAPPVIVVVVYRFLPVPVVPRRDLRPVTGAPRYDEETGAPLFAPPSTPESWRADNLRVSGSKTVQVASGSQPRAHGGPEPAPHPDRAADPRHHRAGLPVRRQPARGARGQHRGAAGRGQGPGRAAQPQLGGHPGRLRGRAPGTASTETTGASCRASRWRPTRARSAAEVLAGSPRGQYRTLQIRGQESNQGPYFLGGGSPAATSSSSPAASR